MGHVLLGSLPKTRAWNEVVRLLVEKADADVVAVAAQEASDAAFAVMDKDPGFQDVIELLSQLGVAAEQSDPAAHLASYGIKIPANPSLVSVALALKTAIDTATAKRAHLSDLAIIGGRSLISAVTQHLNNVLGTLIPATGAEITSTLATLGRETQFGKLARTFFFNVAKDCQRHFLSKELGAHVGEGRAFPTTAQLSNFEHALDTHAHEASQIVEVFAKEWFSKRMYEDANVISKKRSSAFGWKAMEKIRAEMKKRATHEEP
jgi:hypothetical protein